VWTSLGSFGKMIVLNVADQWKCRTQRPRVRNLSGEEGHERVITHEEEHAYLSAAPELLKDFATIALDTGLRPDSELCVLPWEPVHFEPAGDARLGYVHIPRGKTKNSKRNVPLSSRVRMILERRWEGGKEGADRVCILS
jgi:integrase